MGGRRCHVNQHRSFEWSESSLERGNTDSEPPSLASWALAEPQPKDPGGESDTPVLKMGEALQL